MTGLMFPKSPAKKKKRQHRDSILQKKDGRCWLCMRLHGDYTQKAGIHKHHVFFGQGQREISEANGFTVYLCWNHHIHDGGPEAVHKNHDTCLLIQQETQRKYEQTHSREDFIRLIGRSYL